MSSVGTCALLYFCNQIDNRGVNNNNARQLKLRIYSQMN